MIDNKTFWDKIAARYARDPIRNMAAYEATLDRVRHYLHPDQHLLELGCGTGTTALRLADAVGQITATDLSSGMIAIARDKARDAGVDNVRFETAEIARAGGGGLFDVVMAMNLLHLVPDLPGALAQIHARLPPGGLFISKTVCLAQPGQGALRFVLPVILPVMQVLNKAPSKVHRLTIPALETLIAEAGFDIVETGNYPARPPSRFVVARRL